MVSKGGTAGFCCAVRCSAVRCGAVDLWNKDVTGGWEAGGGVGGIPDNSHARDSASSFLRQKMFRLKKKGAGGGGAPRTRKRHQQEHRPQRPTERSDPTQHAKRRTGDCLGPCNETATRQNVTQGERRPPTTTPTSTPTDAACQHQPPPPSSSQDLFSFPRSQITLWSGEMLRGARVLHV